VGYRGGGGSTLCTSAEVYVRAETAILTTWRLRRNRRWDGRRCGHFTCSGPGPQNRTAISRRWGGGINRRFFGRVVLPSTNGKGKVACHCTVRATDRLGKCGGAWSRATPCRPSIRVACHGCEDAGSAAAGTHAFSVSQSNGESTQRVPSGSAKTRGSYGWARLSSLPVRPDGHLGTCPPPPLIMPRATSSSPRALRATSTAIRG
jgi:hypothetical protein